MHPELQWSNFLYFNASYGYNALGTGRESSGSTYQSLGLNGEWHKVSGGIFVQPSMTLAFSALTENRVRFPSEMIAIGDYPGTAYQDGDIAGASDDQDDFIADRHEGGGNVVFCDDHVEFSKQTNWMSAVDDARQRWNNDHQPHPESWR